MGKRMLEYLFDTNILIYYFADRIPSESLVKVEEILKKSFNASIITNIEFLGWSGHTDAGYRRAVEFMEYSRIFPLNEEISEITIDLRRKNKIKLPDAVIAATAINYDLSLITRNGSDFKNIRGIEIYNPFE